MARTPSQIGANGTTVRVEITLVDTTEDVARHNYKAGERKAKIFVSAKARPSDFTRALAHELAEIQSIAAGVEANRPALQAGSTSTDLDAHDPHVPG